MQIACIQKRERGTTNQSRLCLFTEYEDLIGVLK